MPKTFFMLAGEASGDTHAARLVAQLKLQSPGARCVGMGGAAMVAAGFDAFKDLDGMQVVGFWEVAKKYGFFRRVFYELLDKLKQTRPDALICIDYPGFNLRFAEEVKKLGIPVFYYIVPQVWAWKESRAKKMARLVDRAFCVFEFEPPFFEKHGLKTEFVGHPLVDEPEKQAFSGPFACGTQEAEYAANPSSRPPMVSYEPPMEKAKRVFAAESNANKTVSFLPGSRNSEIRHHLRPMVEGFMALQKMQPKSRALFSKPPGVRAELFAPLDGAASVQCGERGERGIAAICGADENPSAASEWIHTLNGSAFAHSRSLPEVSDFSVVKSGTSTLEAGLAGNPLCVIYKGSTASYLIARMLVNIPVFSLVNIVLGRYAVPELLQSEVNPARLAEEIKRGLFDTDYREKRKAALAEIPGKLGGPGASARAARAILKLV